MRLHGSWLNEYSMLVVLRGSFSYYNGRATQVKENCFVVVRVNLVRNLLKKILPSLGKYTDLAFGLTPLNPP